MPIQKCRLFVIEVWITTTYRTHANGTHLTDEILTAFQIRWKYVKQYSTFSTPNHYNYLHVVRLHSCRDIRTKQMRWEQKTFPVIVILDCTILVRWALIGLRSLFTDHFRSIDGIYKRECPVEWINRQKVSLVIDAFEHVLYPCFIKQK